MEKGKKSAEIRAQAIKITRKKKKILKQSGVPVTAAVKAERIKASIAETAKKNIAWCTENVVRC